jgi:hypothetical protein
MDPTARPGIVSCPLDAVDSPRGHKGINNLVGEHLEFGRDTCRYHLHEAAAKSAIHPARRRK